MAGELILIVEDNEKNRKLERDVLHAKGYRTIEAETGEDAVRLARERRPALVLMDIQLPGTDGITALRQLRANSVTRAIPVIAVTASVMQLSLDHSSQARYAQTHQTGLLCVGSDMGMSSPLNNAQGAVLFQRIPSQFTAQLFSDWG